MAAGTGNLEWFLPAEAYNSVYLSSLLEEDVSYCSKLFPGAIVFQYDYLNDDIDSVFENDPLFASQRKMPERLLADLANPKIKWIVFINPPFATSQKAGTSGESKKNVSNTSRIAFKVLTSEHRTRFLSKWINRADATEVFPPLGGAISVKAGNKDTRNRVAVGFLASLMCKGNDVQMC